MEFPNKYAPKMSNFFRYKFDKCLVESTHDVKKKLINTLFN